MSPFPRQQRATAGQMLLEFLLSVSLACLLATVVLPHMQARLRHAVMEFERAPHLVPDLAADVQTLRAWPLDGQPHLASRQTHFPPIRVSPSVYARLVGSTPSASGSDRPHPASRQAHQ